MPLVLNLILPFYGKCNLTCFLLFIVKVKQIKKNILMDIPPFPLLLLRQKTVKCDNKNKMTTIHKDGYGTWISIYLPVR